MKQLIERLGELKDPPEAMNDVKFDFDNECARHICEPERDHGRMEERTLETNIDSNFYFQFQTKSKCFCPGWKIAHLRQKYCLWRRETVKWAYSHHRKNGNVLLLPA